MIIVIMSRVHFHRKLFMKMKMKKRKKKLGHVKPNRTQSVQNAKPNCEATSKFKTYHPIANKDRKSDEKRQTYLAKETVKEKAADEKATKKA